mmetsp:Transcript_33078/g.66715  ORF Transcript_33078/g.66715 Transcript_33078/m.66715 type:complete len:259 (-) Transcript_33078:190-966(-)
MIGSLKTRLFSNSPGISSTAETKRKEPPSKANRTPLASPSPEKESLLLPRAMPMPSPRISVQMKIPERTKNMRRPPGRSLFHQPAAISEDPREKAEKPLWMTTAMKMLLIRPTSWVEPRVNPSMRTWIERMKVRSMATQGLTVCCWFSSSRSRCVAVSVKGTTDGLGAVTAQADLLLRSIFNAFTLPSVGATLLELVLLVLLAIVSGEALPCSSSSLSFPSSIDLIFSASHGTQSPELGGWEWLGFESLAEPWAVLLL